MNNDIIASIQDPWQPYDSAMKHKPKPVPESEEYGAIFMLLVILFLKVRKRFMVS